MIFISCLAQSISIAFYCIGFGEALAVIVSADNVKVFSQLVAAASVLVMFAFAWMGSDWATRFQYVVMVILVAALTSPQQRTSCGQAEDVYEKNDVAKIEGDLLKI